MKYHVNVNKLFEQVAALREKGSPVKKSGAVPPLLGRWSQKRHWPSLYRPGRHERRWPRARRPACSTITFKTPTVDRGWL